MKTIFFAASLMLTTSSVCFADWTGATSEQIDQVYDEMTAALFQIKGTSVWVRSTCDSRTKVRIHPSDLSGVSLAYGKPCILLGFDNQNTFDAAIRAFGGDSIVINNVLVVFEVTGEPIPGAKEKQ